MGGALVWLFQAGSFNLHPAGMTYADFAATLLGGVAVLLTILGLFIALLAIWGLAGFRSVTQSAAKDHLDRQLKEGELKQHIEKLVGDFLASDLRAGKLRELVEERVDYVIFHGAADRAEEESETGEDRPVTT